MGDNTYIELNKNNKTTIQINAWNRATGQPFYPSGAYYLIKGTRKDNIIIPRSPARVYQNQIWTTITQTITASAAEYDIIWEIHRIDGDITNHCTKLLVIDTC
jgi:hypothetical protein